jgi:glucosamine-6-phosphate deaminase
MARKDYVRHAVEKGGDRHKRLARPCPADGNRDSIGFVAQVGLRRDLAVTHSDVRFDDLRVTVFSSPDDLAVAAVDAFVAAVAAALRETVDTAVLLATGNSQLGFLRRVREHRSIPWDRVNVFHMDEYVGLPAAHPASFRSFLHRELVDHVNPRSFAGIEGDAPQVPDEMDRYARLLRATPPAVTVMGIGENGHLAFNDPPADFAAAEAMRLVALDGASRRQQVGEGHFPDLDAVPTHALTVTIPVLLAAPTVLALAPEKRKAPAVRAALVDPVSPHCPASILRRHSNARLFLDTESASLLP